MTEEPVLLASSLGPIAGVLTLPDDPPVAAVYVLQGWACPRSDANQMWTRMARSLSEAGIATLRVDYAGRGESWDADRHERVPAADEAAQWLDRRLGDVPWVVVAYCYGLSPAVRVCRERRNVAGVAVVNPALYPAFLALAPQKRSLSHRVQTLRAAVRLLPRRSLYLLRFGRAESWWAKQTVERKPREELEELARTVPTWIYASASDYCVEPVQSILANLDGSRAVELELNDSVDMRDARTPEAQDALVDGIAAYILRCVTHTQAAT